jgi:hypothetical protein
MQSAAGGTSQRLKPARDDSFPIEETDRTYRLIMRKRTRTCHGELPLSCSDASRLWRLVEDRQFFSFGRVETARGAEPRGAGKIRVVDLRAGQRSAVELGTAEIRTRKFRLCVRFASLRSASRRSA